jgi:dTMP kinase
MPGHPDSMALLSWTGTFIASWRYAGQGDLRRGRLLPWLLRTLPAPDVVLHLDVSPETAHQRILARGTDEESVTELTALRNAYRALPEYAGMVNIDAGGPPAGVLAGLLDAVDFRRLLKV